MNIKKFIFGLLLISLSIYALTPDEKKTMQERTDMKLKDNNDLVDALKKEKTEVMNTIETLKTGKTSTQDAVVVASLDKLIQLMFEYVKDLDARIEAVNMNTSVLSQYKDSELK